VCEVDELHHPEDDHQASGNHKQDCCGRQDIDGQNTHFEPFESFDRE
jgi:hypothetical protein